MKPLYGAAVPAFVVLVVVAGFCWASTSARADEIDKLFENFNASFGAEKYQDAERYAQAMLQTATTNAWRAASLNCLGRVARIQDKLKEAEDFFLQADQIEIPANFSNNGWIPNNLGLVYRDQKRIPEAEAMFRRALKAFDAQQNNQALPTVLSNLESLKRDQGHYAEAEPFNLRRLTILEARLGTDDLEVATALSDLASLYYHIAQFAQAEQRFQRCLKIREAKLGAKHADVIEVQTKLALTYLAMTRYDLAEPLFQRSLELRAAMLGPDHPDVAVSLESLAGLYWKMAQYQKAEPLYLRSLKIREADAATNPHGLAASLQQLSLVYLSMKEYAKAEPLLRRSLKILEDDLGPEHPDVASSLMSLAYLESELGKYDQAEPFYERSLKIREAKLGPDHPEVGRGLVLLASFYHFKLGQYQKAEPVYQRSLNILKNHVGPNHPDVAISLNAFAVLKMAMNQPVAAGDAQDQARRIVRQHVAQVLPLLSEQEQLNFLERRDRMRLYSALSLGLSQRGDAALAARSAAWLANDKALTQETLVRRVALARQSNDPQMAETVKQLEAVRTELANLINAPLNAGQEQARQTKMVQLSQREQELARQLRRPGDPAALANWVEIAEIRRAIPRNAMLVDLALLRPVNFTAKGSEEVFGPFRYVAWLTPPAGAGEVQVVDLGEAEKIDAAVAAFQAAFAPCQSSQKAINPLLKLGEVEAEKELQISLAALAKLVLDPLLPQLKDKDELILSPDAALWLAPWAGLPLPQGSATLLPPGEGARRADEGSADSKITAAKKEVVKAQTPLQKDTLAPALSQRERGSVYAIEKWNIRYVVSARHVLPLAGEVNQATLSGARIFANPDYDLDGNAARASLDNVFRGLGIAAGGASKPLAANSSSTTGNQPLSRSANSIGRVPKLPGTESEANAILPNLKKFVPGEARLYLGEQALEGVFKKIRSPRVLVLSTHGFFLPSQEAQQSGSEQSSLAAADHRAAPLLDQEGNSLENPLLRCGLLLAGCNQRGRSTDPSLDDGVLSGMEIVGTDLRGTELVVLSACETGLGKVNNGEGVAGLRQAFQLAGAQAVVATLWQIPDQATAQLMNDFFANLAAGQKKSDALRHAQLARIKARRDKFGAAHPLFWAAFTLTGGN